MTRIDDSQVPDNAAIHRKYRELLRYAQRNENGIQGSGPKPNAEELKLAEASRDFEALFIRQMLDEMRRGLHENTVLGLDDENSLLAADKNRNSFFRDQMYQDIAENMANQNGFGIGSVLFEQLYRQENQPSALVRQQKQALQQRQALQQAQIQNRFYK